METESERDAEATINAVKDMRARLENRIRTQHDAHLDLLSSLQSTVPDIVPSLDLSLRVISSFTNRPFVATPPLPEPSLEKKHHPIAKLETQQQRGHGSKSMHISTKQRDSGSAAEADGSSGSPMALVRAMVAECLLQRVPFDATDSSSVLRKLENDKNARPAEKAALRDLGGERGPILAVETALKSISEENGSLELEAFEIGGNPRIMIWAIDRTRLLKELPESFQGNSKSSRVVETPKPIENSTPSGGFGVSGSGNFQRPPEMWSGDPNMGFRPMMSAPRGMGMMGMHHPMGMMGRPPPFPLPLPLPVPANQKLRSEEDDLKDVEALLSKKSFKEKQQSKTGEELLDLIHRPTAKEAATAAKFKSKGGSQVKYYCRYLTKEDCRLQCGSHIACNKRHFRRLVASHTDVSLGDCSFLDTCRHMKTCKYVHYELDMADAMMAGPDKALKPLRADYCSEAELGEAQWINCDIRSFRMDILGTFGVVMADPPWDIHMELPYGTMGDDEMRTLNVPSLQTDGLIFLWVTGRAMELGRECLELWGYKRVEEIIWVKTNQLQRIIRTGRTGHWLNHSKEHCLVGIKGNPEVNRNIDTDVIVAEVRETSRKPDEMYAMLERIMPRARKLELFARMHNAQAGWLSLGNQLNGVRLINEGLRARFKASYPEIDVQPPSPPRASATETDNEPMAIDSITA
uniref:N6-adenosine-methyltransferase MT-A70-like n=1 Tax=Noccaea caerulescens TaxID=107243 RepID=A0A1J3J0Q5_NOCCA